MSNKVKVSFFSKLAAVRNLDGEPFQRAVDQMAEALAANDAAGLLAGRGAFLQAGFAQLHNFYLCSVLGGLIPAGQRLAHQVAQHSAFEPRDTLRYHQALLDSMLGGDAGRVEELVRAFNGREQKLATGCSERAPLATTTRLAAAGRA